MISINAKIGKNVVIRDNVVIEDGVTINDNCYLDYGCIIRRGVTLGENSYVGSYSILGEHQMDFHNNRKEPPKHELLIGKNALIRSHTVLYSGSSFEEGLQTGHHVTVREGTKAGKNLRLGTLTDIQGACEIGDHVNMHSNVHVGRQTKIGNYVWIFPYTVFTNDPIPPSEIMKGCNVEDYSIVATGTIVLPGLNLGENSFISAGAVVTKDIPDGMFAVGCPAKIKGSVSQLKHPETGDDAYPWPRRFDRYMPWAGTGFDEWKRNE